MSGKLKPCPFCGGEAELAIVKLWNHVYCKSCHARTTMYSSDEQAIEAWNKRPNPWHTGKPTEEGLYLIKTKIGNDIPYFVAYWKFDHWFSNCQYFIIREDVIKWQKIEDKETDNE